MKNKTPLEREVDRIKILVYGLAAALVIIFSMLVYGLAQNAQAIQQGHQAICSAKANYEHQIRATDKFLKTHPHGIPGIPKALFLQGEATTKAQLHALRNISCS